MSKLNNGYFYSKKELLFNVKVEDGVIKITLGDLIEFSAATIIDLKSQVEEKISHMKHLLNDKEYETGLTVISMFLSQLVSIKNHLDNLPEKDEFYEKLTQK